jgi:hypothetical protein
LCHPFRALGQQEEFHIPALTHDVPGFFPPRVSLLQEKIGGHANPDQLATFDFVLSLAILLQRVAKPRLGAVNGAAILASLGIQKVHIAVLTAFAALDAAVPGIPYIVHNTPLFPVFFLL